MFFYQLFLIKVLFQTDYLLLIDEEKILSFIVNVLEPLGPFIVNCPDATDIDESFGIVIFFFPILDMIKIPYKLFLHLYFFFLASVSDIIPFDVDNIAKPRPF